jgi:hypothetical protein
VLLSDVGIALKDGGWGRTVNIKDVFEPTTLLDDTPLACRIQWFTNLSSSASETLNAISVLPTPPIPWSMNSRRGLPPVSRGAKKESSFCRISCLPVKKLLVAPIDRIFLLDRRS